MFTEFRKIYQYLKNRDGAAWNSAGLSYSTTGELYLLGDNTSTTNPEVRVLLTPTANFIGQLSRILNNNLNLKARIW